jgi:DNA polymerase IV
MDGRRTVAHLDMDAFYVAVELLRRPELRGKPVVVAGSGPRAVVTTASYEARPYGVGSAIPAATARRRCPDAIFIPPDFPYYRQKSSEVRSLVADIDAPSQWVSLDEVYLELSSQPYPIETMSSLVRRIRDEVGLDASVGIGPNKLVAKVASDAEKPRGFVVLTREQGAERFAGEAPRLLPGIGPKTAKRLEGYGVTTIGALQRCTVAGLCERFGSNQGRYLHDLAHFRHDSEVAEQAAKSRSVESTFDTDISGLDELEEILEGQARRLAKELRERETAGRTVAIKVRLDDWTTVTRAHTLPEPTNDAELIIAESRALLRAYDPPRPVRLLGVRVGAFAEDDATTAPDASGQATLV